MNTEGRTSMGVLGMLVPVVICAVALAVGYKAHVAARDVRQAAQNDIAAVQTRLDVVAAQLGAMSNAIAAVAGRKPSSTIVSSSSGGWSGGKDDMTDSLLALESDLSDIRKTLDKTGIEGASTNDLDQAALRDIIAERKELLLVDQRRVTLEKLRTAQTAADIDKHGAELTNLFAQARSRWGRDRNEEDDKARDAALKELEQKFPDAYATAKAVGDRAVGAIFSRDTEKVEQYYKQLSDMKQASEVVNDWGIQTMPAVEYYLARQYVEQKRYSDAEKMLSSIEKKYKDSLIPTMGDRGHGRGPGGDHGPRLVTSQSAVSGLRGRMQEN